MEYRKLGNTDMMVSKLSFGASSLGRMFRDADAEESLRCARRVIELGINYIDTAPWYGQGESERVLGKALKDIPRDKYYIATKAGRYEKEVDKMMNFTAERTLRSVDESLERLGIPYVDVIQVHDLEYAPSLDIILNETLPALQKVKDQGKARYIGITAYPLQPLKELIERSTVKIDTILTYCRCSMNDTSLYEYMPFFQEHGIGVINASPISMGLLTTRGPPAWHPAHQDIKDVCAQAVHYCQEREVDISRLAMHFCMDQPDIPTTLVGTASTTNLEKNVKVLQEPLSTIERQTMEEVMTKFMKPLNNKHWEGVEPDKYWKDLKALQQK